MTELEDFISRIERLNVMEVAVETINETKKEFLDLNRDQLRHGKKSTGPIGHYSMSPRWQWYGEMKNRMNPLPGLGNVDLILTGSFSNKMTLKAAGNTYSIDSEDEKTTSLLFKYGTDTFGLDGERQPTYNQTIFLPLFIRKIQQITGIVPN